MKIPAAELNGTNIGDTITHEKIVLGRWDAETRSYPDRFTMPVQSVITMITHKKNGQVNVRVFPTTGDLMFAPDYEVELS